MSRGLSLAPCGLVIERIESGKRIQVLRMPVSPSGRRSRCEVRSGRCGQVEKAKQFLASGKGVRQVAKMAGISPASVSRIKTSMNAEATRI